MPPDPPQKFTPSALIITPNFQSHGVGISAVVYFKQKEQWTHLTCKNLISSISNLYMTAPYSVQTEAKYNVATLVAKIITCLYFLSHALIYPLFSSSEVIWIPTHKHYHFQDNTEVINGVDRFWRTRLFCFYNTPTRIHTCNCLHVATSKYQWNANRNTQLTSRFSGSGITRHH